MVITGFCAGGHKKPADYKAVEVGLVNPKAVICADSACFYQGLIDIEPETLLSRPAGQTAPGCI